MRLVILTGLGLEHRFVTRALLDAFPGDVAAIVVAQPPPRNALARWRSYRRRYSWAELLSRACAKAYRRIKRLDRHKDRILSQRLFPQGAALQTSPVELLRTVPSHNGREALELLDGLRPDIIAVYGTAVIRPPVMTKARQAVLNMHTGISPRYRGSDTVFWPLHNEEPEWIGTTVHQLDAGIDSGPVLATVRPAIDAADDEDTLFAKCVLVGADAYARVIAAVAAGSATPLPQDLAAGREYRFVDRTVSAERRVRRLLRNGLLRDFAAKPGARTADVHR